MNRLQKKCLYVSVGTHALLVLILIVGPAFLTSSDRLTTHQLLTVISLDNIVDNAPSTGGNPNVRVTPPPQVEPEVTPPPVARPLPRPPEPEVTRPQPNPARDNEVTRPVPTTRRSEFTRVTTPTRRPPTRNVQTDTGARRAAQNASNIATAITRGVRSLTKDLSPSTSVEMPGPGGAELMAANYNDVVASIYTHAWTPPPSLDDDSAVVTTSITISRNGKVAASKITKSSGNASMDKSIETTLRNVTFVAPFPASSKDSERTFTISFSLKAKRLLG